MKLENLEFEEGTDFKIPEKKDKKEKNKDNRTLFQKLFKTNKLKKPNKVAVILLLNNGRAEIMELESKYGFFTINKKVYHEDKDCIYTIGKERYPLAIIPEDNLTPIGTKKYYERSLQEIGQTLQNHIMKGIRHAEIVRMGEKDGGKLNVKTAIAIGVIILIIVAVVVGYV